ncbi:MAG TPA: hypothetical protein VGF45_16020 [Polyangia bacterium]
MTESQMMKTEDVRCRHCGALLARVEGNALTLTRGGLQATFQGSFHASFVCYRPGCQRLNVRRMPAEGAETDAQPG